MPETPDKIKFARVVNPIQITDIVVSQQRGMGEFYRPSQYATADNYLKRIKLQMGLHAAIANKEHEKMNFEADPSNSAQFKMKPGKENEIVRLSSNEFFFYPGQDPTKGKPLSLKEFQDVVDAANDIGKKCHENLHLVFASFPVEGPDNQIYNLVVHVQCGKNPIVNSFAKSVPNENDPIYPGKKNLNFMSESFVPDVLSKEIQVHGSPKTIDDVIHHVSTYSNVTDWLQATKQVVDSIYPESSLNACLDELLEKIQTRPLDQADVDRFKMEMDAFKAQFNIEIEVNGSSKTIDDVVKHVSTYGSCTVVKDWLEATKNMVINDNIYPAPALVACLERLIKKIEDEPLTEENIDQFKMEMYDYKQRIIAVLGRVYIPSTSKTLKEMVIEIRKNLNSPDTRDMALQQLDYLEKCLILPLDDITTEINDIRNGIMIANSIDKYNASMSKLTRLIEQGETVDSNTSKEFMNDYTGLRYLLKMTYESIEMQQNDVDQEFIKVCVGLELVLQKIERQQRQHQQQQLQQQDIAEFETSFQALITSVDIKDYQGGELDKTRIKQLAEEFIRAFNLLEDNLINIYEVDEINKFKVPLEEVLQKIYDDQFNASDVEKFQQAVTELKVVLGEVKNGNKLNDDDIQKFSAAKRALNQELIKLERKGNLLCDVEPLKISINVYQEKSVVNRIERNLDYLSRKELVQLIKEYRDIKEIFEINKNRKLSIIENDSAAKSKLLSELLTEYKQQLTPLLEKIKNASTFTQRTDIGMAAQAILDSSSVEEKLFKNFDEVAKSINIMNIPNSRTIDEIFNYLNYIDNIIKQNDPRAKKAVGDVIKHLQEGTLDKNTVDIFVRYIEPYEDKIKYWNFPDHSFNKGFSHNSTIKCVSAGGTEFYTAIDVCLDHLYEIAKHTLDKTITSSLGVPSVQVSHMITANTVERQENKLFTPNVTHADLNDDDDARMGVYEKGKDKLKAQSFLLTSESVPIQPEYSKTEIEVSGTQLVVKNPYFGSSELEFYKSPPHQLAPLTLNGRERSEDTYTREYYINQIEKLLLMGQDHIHARNQHEEINQFIAKLNELKSDTSLTGRKLLGEINVFKENISKFDNSNALVDQVWHIEDFIAKRLLLPNAYEKQFGLVFTVRKMLITPNLKNDSPEQVDLIQKLFFDITKLSKTPMVTGQSLINKLDEYRAKADLLDKRHISSTLKIKLDDIEKTIYQIYFPREYKEKYIDNQSSPSNSGLGLYKK